MTHNEIIDAILKREGSEYTNRASDRGGPTRYGVTQAALAEYRGRPVTPAEVAALTEDEAREIYVKRYINDPGFNAIGSDTLRAVMVDFGVNSGPAKATKALQKCLGLAQDGVFGHDTKHATDLRDGRRLALLVLAERQRFLGAVVTNDVKALHVRMKAGQPVSPADVERLQAFNAAGWANRVADQIEDVA